MTVLNEIKKYSDHDLHHKLKTKIESEREILADIICFIHEVDGRRLYFKFGYPSLFDYLTKEMKYSSGSAQRRINAARLLKDAPEVKEYLENGSLNLGQISLIAQGVNQRVKESNALKSTSTVAVDDAAKISSDRHELSRMKKQLVETVKGLSLPDTQAVVAKNLNLELKKPEQKIIQKDNSVCLTITLSAEEAEVLQRAKLLLSHVNPGAKDAEIITFALRELVKRRDPVLQKGKTTKKSIALVESGLTVEHISLTPHLPVESILPIQHLSSVPSLTPAERAALPSSTKRAVFGKHPHCQWKEKYSNSVCGSKFQLQIDHIKPIWAGGGNEENNLQVLCGAHNREKYLRERGQRRAQN